VKDKPGKSVVNILEAFKLADAVTAVVGGKDLALVATAFGMVLGRAAQPLNNVQQVVLQNHVCKYMSDFAEKPL
jgi:hypothetical protein